MNANQNFLKIILSGILFCLIVIAVNLTGNNDAPIIQGQSPNVVIDSQSQVVQIAENRIGVIDTGQSSGWEQLVVFEYNPETREFEIVSTLSYEDYLNHPEEHGIPIKDQKINY